MQGARQSVRPGAKIQRRGRARVRARGRRQRPAPAAPAFAPEAMGRAAIPGSPARIRYSALAATLGVAICSRWRRSISSRGCPTPRSAALDDRPPNVTVLAQDGTVLAERGLRRGHVRLDVLPPYLVAGRARHRGPALLRPFRRRPARTDPRVVPQRLRPAPWSKAARPSPSSLPRTCSSGPSAPSRGSSKRPSMRCGSSSASRRTKSSSSISTASISAAAPTGSRPPRAAISASRRASSRCLRRRCSPGCSKAPSRYAPTRSVKRAERPRRRGAR